MIIVPLARGHDRASFSCGEPHLDDYLKKFAGQHQRWAVNQTYAAVEKDSLLGFVTVSLKTMRREEIGAPAKQHPPLSLPVLLLARLAVDSAAARRGYGGALFRHVCRLARQLRELVGCVGVFVDAKPGAVGWYKELGFEILGDAVSEFTPMFLLFSRIPPETTP